MEGNSFLASFEAQLDSDLSRRKREQVTLLLLATSQDYPEEHKKIFRRSSALLSYAHWEGFVKDNLKRYIHHVFSIYTTRPYKEHLIMHLHGKLLSKNSADYSFLNEVCIPLSISLQQVAEHKSFLNDTLVRTRNRVAHGVEIDIEESLAREIVEKNLVIMDIFKSSLLAAVEASTFCSDT